MNSLTLTRHRRGLYRTAVALSCAGVIALGALPAIPGTVEVAEAKPKPLDPGKRCDELYGINGVKTGRLPAGDASRAKDLWDTYDYINPAKQFDGLPEPDLSKIGTNPDKYPKGSAERVYAYYKKAITSKPGSWDDFRQYLTEQYIPQSGWDPRGKAFEAKVVREMGLVGPDWICQKEVYFVDEDGKKHRRQLDAFNKKTREIVEIKSNGKPERSQIPKDKAWAKHQGWRSYKYTFVFAEEQKSEAKKFMREMKQLAGADRVREYNYHSRGKEKAPSSTGPYRRNDPYMNADPNKSNGSRGGAGDMIDRSRRTPADMARQIERARAADPNWRAPRGPGGIDFSTLDLRYVGKPVKGEGLDYAFSAKEDPTEQSGFGGKEKAQLISDSFFTWLALTPDRMYVNLNPDQPDQIMDNGFGKTDAGRVLLDADMEMKRDFSRALDYKKPEGKLFWDQAAKVDGMPCIHTTRNWIEPEPAQVREQDGGIYILDAPMKVSSVAQKYDTEVPGNPCSKLTDDQIKHNQRLIDQLIVPVVEKQINEDAKYGDLRRVYTARVAAEFIRRQDAKAPTDYRPIINSNKLEKWPLRGDNAKWDKMTVWKEMVKSFKEGEVEFEVPSGGQVYIYSLGGVEFGKAPKRNISQTRFKAEHPYLPRSTKTSVDVMTDDVDRQGTLLLGGNSAGRSEDGGGDPTPTPTPTSTPTPTDPPTDTPTTPAPDPSTPGGGDTGKPTPPGEDPDGDLADTGSDTPVGLITGIAAALAAAGGALYWWMRRRKTAMES